MSKRRRRNKRGEHNARDRSALQRRFIRTFRQRLGDPLRRLRNSLRHYNRSFDRIHRRRTGFPFLIQYDPCAYCARPSESWDHLEPRSRGGRTHADNLIRACLPCNHAKGVASLLHYLAAHKAAEVPHHG
jgi:5-methylcytosine-specific restriction endonuclease McrA